MSKELHVTTKKKFFVNKVIIMGELSNYKDITMNSRTILKLSIAADTHYKTTVNSTPLEIEVSVEDQKLISRIRNHLQIGMEIYMEGRIKPVISSASATATKRYQYIYIYQVTLPGVDMTMGTTINI